MAQEEEVDEPVEEAGQDTDPLLDVNDEEDGYCLEFLKKFLIASESAFLDRIDIILMMRALPISIMAKNRAKISMFMFNVLQASLIAFSTTGSVQAFEFYDKLNKQRVQTVSDIILAQKTKLENVQQTMIDVKAKV